MSERRLITQYGPLVVNHGDGEYIQLRTNDNESWLVNRVYVRVTASWNVKNGGFHYFHVRRDTTLSPRGSGHKRWDDTTSKSIDDKVRDELLLQGKAAVAAFPELIVAGKVYEYKRQKNSYTEQLRKAEKEAQDCRVELARLESNLTDEMRAFMVEEKLGE